MLVILHKQIQPPQNLNIVYIKKEKPLTFSEFYPMRYHINLVRVISQTLIHSDYVPWFGNIVSLTLSTSHWHHSFGMVIAHVLAPSLSSTHFVWIRIVVPPEYILFAHNGHPYTREQQTPHAHTTHRWFCENSYNFIETFKSAAAHRWEKHTATSTLA